MRKPWLWDYKPDVPRLGVSGLNAWANVAKDVLSFHNKRGGVIIFGFSDSFEFVGAKVRLDSKLINDQLRRYLPDTVWVEFHREFIQSDQRYVGIAVIPPNLGKLACFTCDAPTSEKKQLFKKGGSAIRIEDSSYVLSVDKVDEWNRKDTKLQVGQKYYVDEPFYRVPSPEYVEFVYRQEPCAEIEAALRDPRTSVAHVIGIGGLGKTALATWAAIRAYESNQFDFIVSCTAKDRELTASGIAGLKPEVTSFESLLNAVCDTLQFPEYKQGKLDEREDAVRNMLRDSNGLLFVDNLETVDDLRIIRFLDTLPVGVRALVTSRRLTVKFAVYPVTLGPMNAAETCSFVRSLQSLSSCSYVSQFRDDQILRIGEACNHIPLAMRWMISKSKSASAALKEVDATISLGMHGEELLEFSFRRVFEQMVQNERTVLEVLSLFAQPQPSEVLLVGSALKLPELQDALSTLIEDAIVVKHFNQGLNDECYTVLAITRSFIYSELVKNGGREQTIRVRLRDYFEARDIKNEDDRIVVRSIRQSAGKNDSALLDLAESARRRGDLASAEDLLKQAISRNPRNWRAYRSLAELQRHEFKRPGEALRLYEQAAANSPKDRIERAKLYREWGILLRDSGQTDAVDQAASKLEEAHELNSRDWVTVTALAQIYDRRGASAKVIELCEPLKREVYGKTKEKMLPLLLKAYQRSGEVVAVAEIRALLGQ